MENRTDNIDYRLFNCENMLQMIMQDKMIYNFGNGYELNFIIQNFSELSVKNIKDKYLKLIKKLDENSVKTVQLIINRCRYLLHVKRGNIDLFSCQEKQKLKNVYDEFGRYITQLDENLWTYKNYLLPSNHLDISVFYYDCMINEFDDLSDLEYRSIIDVGGFIGDSALVLDKYTKAPLYVFEPDENNFRLLNETIRLNDLKNVVPEKLVLGDENKNVTMNVGGSMSSVAAQMGDLTCKQVTLDSYVSEHNINVGLIKVDIEGYEKQFLQGAKETIISQKPKLLISIYHNFEQFFGIKPMLEEWRTDYKFKIVKPVDGSVLLETVLIGEPHKI